MNIQQVLYRTCLVVLFLLVLPVVLMWCLVYGVIVGIIGITVDRYESVRDFVHRDAKGHLKYPKWHKEKFEAAYLRSLNTEEEKDKAFREMQAGTFKTPKMIVDIITDIFIFGFLCYPPLLVWGIITGPVRAFSDFFKWFYKIYTGHSVYKGGW